MLFGNGPSTRRGKGWLETDEVERSPAARISRHAGWKRRAIRARRSVKAGRSDQRWLVQLHDRAIRCPEVPPFTSQNQDTGRIQHVLAVPQQRQLHAVDARAVMVMMLAAVGRAALLAGRIVPASAGVMGGFHRIRVMIMVVTVRILRCVAMLQRGDRTTSAIRRHPPQQTHLDQQGEHDDESGTHVAVGPLLRLLRFNRKRFVSHPFGQAACVTRWRPVICRTITSSAGRKVRVTTEEQARPKRTIAPRPR